MNINRSKELFAQAQNSIPGGVNSPVRAFKGVGGTPLFIEHANGSYLYDVDGNQYIDYINSWGPMILGHAPEVVVKAITEVASRSTSFGAPTELEIKIAELIKTMVPGLEMIRMVNSGTEACMSAIRLARGYTKRNKIIKFEGCYHGHADSFLVKAGSGVATFGIQNVPGVPETVSADTLTVAYNDLRALEGIIAQHPNDIAAIILEPVAGNMGCIPPAEGFLQGLRDLCDQHKIVLIFDEVMTGFRLAAGGAQELFSIQADLVTYGKVIGGGMPVGAFGGKKEIMEHVAPVGNVYQAGTLSGNPIAMSAGYAMLHMLNNNRNIFTELEEKTQRLHERLDQVLTKKDIPYQINRVGSMISVHFSEQPVTDFTSASACNIPLFNKLFHHMLANGIYLPPSAYETWFISTALSENDIEKTVAAFDSFEY